MPRQDKILSKIDNNKQCVYIILQLLLTEAEAIPDELFSPRVLANPSNTKLEFFIMMVFSVKLAILLLSTSCSVLLLSSLLQSEHSFNTSCTFLASPMAIPAACLACNEIFGERNL